MMTFTITPTRRCLFPYTFTSITALAMGSRFLSNLDLLKGDHNGKAKQTSK